MRSRPEALTPSAADANCWPPRSRHTIGPLIEASRHRATALSQMRQSAWIRPDGSEVIARGEAVTVLLGAGASAGAGVPISTSLTERIARSVNANERRYTPTAMALNAAVGAMIAHDSAAGGNPYAGIDVERLFSAVQMLATRNNLEVAPFVASWIAALDNLGRSDRLPLGFHRELREGLEANTPHRVERAFRTAVHALNRSDSEKVFAALERQMLEQLKTALHVDASKVDYLAPLLAPVDGPRRIATLNYDRSVELLADRAGVHWDTGISSWSGGFGWTFSSSASLHLLKMHGSLDWRIRRDQVSAGGLTRERIVQTDGLLDPNSRRQDLGVVFGQRGKLRSDGPFLAMLIEFSRFLDSTDHLVIVGYSFRDEHINSAISRWFLNHRRPQVTIVSPSIGPQIPFDAGEYLRQLLSEITTGQGRDRAARAPHAIYTAYAQDVLREIFGEGPYLKPPASE